MGSDCNKKVQGCSVRLWEQNWWWTIILWLRHTSGELCMIKIQTSAITNTIYQCMVWMSDLTRMYMEIKRSLWCRNECIFQFFKTNYSSNKTDEYWIKLRLLFSFHIWTQAIRLNTSSFMNFQLFVVLFSYPCLIYCFLIITNKHQLITTQYNVIV